MVLGRDEMSAVKKRRLDNASISTPVSAIAARRAKVSAGETAVSVGESAVNSTLSKSQATLEQSVNRKPNTTVFNNPGLETEISEPDGHRTPLRLEVEGTDSVEESRAVSPELSVLRPSIVFSTLKPSSKTVKELKDGTLALKLEPGERLVILGQFEICVQKGQITLLGCSLQPSKTYYRVSAPSSHSLPVIRCASSEVHAAELRVRQCRTGLESLRTLSALFGSLWDDESGSLGWEHSPLLKTQGKSSFRILFNSQDGPAKSFLQPLVSPPEWNAALARIAENTSKKTQSIMLCGPKSSGKSTFAKILSNRLLFTASTSRGVAILDLDPGQPEYSPPGQVSLIYIKEPNFGTPFSHPVTSGKSKTIRSHAIGAITPSLDPSLYMACVFDLYAYYRGLIQQYPNTPLIINTPGWVLGTGLEILVELIAKVSPTEVIYMSLDGPSEVVQSLREANKTVPVVTLPSQGSEYATRTAAHLRTMQNMSYFHLDSASNSSLAWDDTPLTSIPPWQVRYSGAEVGILGVICYGEQPPANLLMDTINGSLVAVVVIDDPSAIAGWTSNNIESQDTVAGNLEQPREVEDNDIHMLDDTIFHPAHLEKPIVVRTPEDIPYFNPANSTLLDPKSSRSIGLALVRGIDVERKCLQLLTPIAPDIFKRVIEEGKNIVLVSGKLDTPGWAYTEAFVQSDTRDKEARRKKEGRGGVETGIDATEGEEDEELIIPVANEELHDAPWVEKLHGSQGRGMGSRVWRVRRDLGKSDGGE